MQSKSKLLQLSLVFATILAGSLISYSQVTSKQIPAHTTKAIKIASLANGSYQFCSQPDKSDRSHVVL